MTLTVEEREIVRISGLSLGTQTVKDQELSPLLEQIQQAQEEMEVLYTKANARITLLQAQCPHANIKKKFENDDSEYNKGELLSKKCLDCGFQFIKPKGMYWMVCKNCWGTMKYINSVQQGKGCLEDRHRCVSCGHEEFTT